MKGDKIDYIKRYKLLVEKVEGGEIAIGDACYEIAGGMAMGILRKDIRLEKIMTEAGELVVTTGKIPRGRNERWEKLKSQINSL